MPEPTVIGGLACGDVLAALSDYLDEAVEPELRARIEEHLRGCSWCTRFGGEFSAVVTGLREALGADALDEDVQQRLAARLEGLFAE